MDDQTYIAQVRALMGDDTIGDYTFTEDQILVLRTIYGDGVHSAAISLLERVAVEEALLIKYVKSYDMTLDGTKAANIVLERAKRLRAERDEIAQGLIDGAFLIVESNASSYLEYEERVL